MPRKSVIIVDPLSTGNLYAPSLAQKGYMCYGVLSSNDLPSKFMDSLDVAKLFENRLFSASEIKSLVPKTDVVAVVCGAETGVYCADELALFFNVRGNDPNTTKWRRSKGAMQNRLQSMNLKSIQSLEITSQTESINIFHSKNGYVVKPDSSCLTDDVLFFNDINGIHTWIKHIDWSKKNAVGDINKSYLLQERLIGDEYVVDMVIDNTSVQICTLCRYRKGLHNDSQFVYEALDVLDIENPTYSELLKYSVKCSYALGIEYGPVHMELMNTEDGPVMIEAGARLHGGIAPILFEQCYDKGLLSSSIRLITEDYIGENSRLIKNARIIFLINENESKYVSDVNELAKQIKAIDNVGVVKLFFKNNEIIPLTTNLANCPGIVTIIADSVTDLDATEAQVRSMF